MRGLTARLLGVVILAVTLAACSVAPQTGGTIGASQSPEQLLERAISAQPLRAAELRLEAAQLFKQQGREQEAAAALAPIDLRIIPPNLRFEIVRIQADYAIAQQNANAALDLLRPSQFQELSVEQQEALSQLRAEAYTQQQNPLAAALELIPLATAAEGERQQSLHNQIWGQLGAVDTETLVAAGLSNYGFFEQGWIELALSLSRQGDLGAQRDSILKWQQLWSEHPANKQPPRALAALINAEILTAGRILVALPFSGNFSQPARMISEGISAAYYARAAQGLPVPELTSVDTEQFNSAADLMAYALGEQVDLIIGPLNPELIDELALLTPLQIPALAFNRSSTPAEGLYQLDLSSDQEVEQIVERAIIEGAQRFALITPAAPWGQNVREDYLEAIERQGASLSAELQYQPSLDLSEQISSLLNTQLSESRHARIRQVLGQSIKFEERPRRDIDAILLTATSANSRQIKPMLAFHFAGGYPVYSTSHLYDGNPNSVRDVDLNGIRFPDLPWTLDPQNRLQQEMGQERGDTRTRLGRLYALGADAFILHPYLMQLEGSREIYFDGNTGRLSLDENRRVQRTLDWAEFTEGVPMMLGAPVPVSVSGSEQADLSSTEGFQRP